MEFADLVRVVREEDWNAIEMGRDRVDEAMLERLLPVYATLPTWNQKIAFVQLIQDTKRADLVRPIMLDVLHAPLPLPSDWFLDTVELTKAIALGHLDDKHDRFMHFYNDREAIHAAVAEVLGAAAPLRPVAETSLPALNPDEPVLLAACIAERKDLVLQEIANGADLTVMRVANRTALHLAASNGWADVVRALIGRGMPVDQLDRYGGTALQAGVHSIGVVRELLAAGADPRIAYQDGRRVAWFAAYNGHTASTLAILDAGYGIDEDCGVGTLLTLAVGENHADLVAALIERGANVNLPAGKAGKRRTPLMEATARDHVAIARTLLAAGADRTLVVDGVRALDLATGSRAEQLRALLA